MRRGQTVRGAVVAVNVEAVNAIHSLELLEAVERHLGGTCDKLDELGTLFLVKRADGAPEPLDLRRRRVVVVVLGVALPVVNVDVGQTRDEQLELLLVEDRDELGGDDVVEACAVLATIITHQYVYV